MKKLWDRLTYELGPNGGSHVPCSLDDVLFNEEEVKATAIYEELCSTAPVARRGCSQNRAGHVYEKVHEAARKAAQAGKGWFFAAN